MCRCCSCDSYFDVFSLKLVALAVIFGARQLWRNYLPATFCTFWVGSSANTMTWPSSMLGSQALWRPARRTAPVPTGGPDSAAMGKAILGASRATWPRGNGYTPESSHIDPDVLAPWKSVSSTNQWCTQGPWDRLPGCSS